MERAAGFLIKLTKSEAFWRSSITASTNHYSFGYWTKKDEKSDSKKAEKTKWVKSDADNEYFIKEGSEWMEYHKGSHYATFKELNRTEDALFLKRLDGMIIMLSDTGAYMHFSKGNWANDSTKKD